MTTKINYFFLNDYQESVTVDNSQTFHANPYSNFNLNKILKCLDVSPVQSNSKSYNNKICGTAATLKPPGSTVTDNIEERKNPSHLNKPSKIFNFSKLINGKTENEESKKPWKKNSFSNTISGTTLSLHIAAYENSVETDSFNGFKNEDLQKGKSDSIKNEKQIFTAGTFVIQNSFEFPRQESEGAKVPEVSNFKASQRLLNPNKASKNAMSQTPSDPEEEAQRLKSPEDERSGEEEEEPKRSVTPEDSIKEEGVVEEEHEITPVIRQRGSHDGRERTDPEKREKRKKRSRSRERRRKHGGSDDDDRKERKKKRSKSPKKRRKHDSDEDDDNRRERKRKRSKSPDKRRKRRSDSEERERRRREKEDMSQRKRRHDSEEPENRHREKEVEDGEVKRGETPEIPKKKEVDPILTRAGGAYIPPARLRMMMEQQADKKDETYQRMNWEKLKKKIHGQVNKVNVGNIVQVVRELLQENVIRGKGLLARSIIQAQTFSPSFSHVYAALVSIINSKFPNIGELIIRRLIIQFKRAFKNLNKATCVTVSTFLGHLANQRVVHELLILELLLVLMKDPTDDSIEIAVNLLKVCGQMLSQVTPQGTFAIFEQLRSILENCNDITSRTQYMIEVLFHVRKEKFISYPSVIEELDLIEEEDQVCHLVHIISEDDKPLDPETGLNVFKYDPNFEENEAQYDEIRQEIIGDADDSDEEEEGGDGGQPAAAGEEDGEAEDTVKPLVSMKIVDMTEAEQAAFRRKVYLTIQSSLDFQEAAHKLIKNVYKPGIEAELCNMIVDCCAQQRSYTPFFGKLAERFCKLRKEFQDSFEKISRDTYHTIHRFDITKLRNMAKLVSHLLSTDSIAWSIFSEVKMTEEDTTSSGRIYIKTIFLELSEVLGLVKLDERLNDPTMKHNFEGLFPKDHPKNSRFAINFFSYIGLSGLTLDLRKHLKKKEKKLKEEAEVKEEASSSSDSSSDSDSSGSSSDSDSDSSSSSSTSSAASSVASPKRTKTKKIKQEIMDSPPRKQIKLEPADDYEHRERRENRSHRGRDDENSHRRRDRGDERRHRDKENERHSRHSPPPRHSSRSPDRRRRRH